MKRRVKRVFRLGMATALLSVLPVSAQATGFTVTDINKAPSYLITSDTSDPNNDIVVEVEDQLAEAVFGPPDNPDKDYVVGVAFNANPNIHSDGTNVNFTWNLNPNLPEQYTDAWSFKDFKNGRVYIPIRVIAKQFGLKVAWDNSTQTATFTSTSTAVSISVGRASAIVNGKKVSIDAPSQSRGGHVYVPVRFLAEAFSCNVFWKPWKPTGSYSDLTMDVVVINSPDFKY